MKIVAALAALSLALLTPLYGAPPTANWLPDDWGEFVGEAVECVVDYGIGTAAAKAGVESSIPLTEIYSALMALPDVTQEALLRRLRVRMEAMALQDDPVSLKKLNLLQAYYTSLAEGDNSRLRELQLQHEAAQKGAPDEGTDGSPQPPTLPPQPGCRAAGSWTHETVGIGSTYWTITESGKATETGKGNAEGTATLSGRRLQINWKTKNGYAGDYWWDLDESCTTGSGKLKFSAGGTGTHNSTVRRNG